MRAVVTILLSFGLIGGTGCAYTLHTGDRGVDRTWKKAEDATAAPTRCFLVTAVKGFWLWCRFSSDTDCDSNQEGADASLRNNRDSQKTPDGNGPEARPLLPQVK